MNSNILHYITFSNKKLFVYGLLILFLTTGFTHSQQLQFKHFTENDGLSQSTIKVIFQDCYGFLWIGTANGLNKYDGYKFQSFLHNEDDSSSISDNFVRAIYQTKDSSIWIGTRNGLNKLDFSRQNSKNHRAVFQSFLFDSSNNYSISSSDIRTIYQDHLGQIWIGTKNGLNKLIKRKEGEKASVAFSRYLNNPEDINTISSNHISSIVEDNSGNLWIGTVGGALNKLNLETEKITRFLSLQNDSLSMKYIIDLFMDRNGFLWIGTYGDGLIKFHTNTHRYTVYKTSANNKSLSSNKILSIHKDKKGFLWVGTLGGGINKFNSENNSFISFKNIPTESSSLSSNLVYSLFIDGSNNLWVGTNNGLNKLDLKHSKFIHYKNDPQSNSVRNNYVAAMAIDHLGNLWLGTNEGLVKIDHLTKKNTHYNLNNVKSVVMDVFVDTKNDLWVGTFGHGLYKYNRENKTFRKYKHNVEDKESIIDDRIIEIYEDDDGNLLIGTQVGICKMNTGTDMFTPYIFSPNDSGKLSGKSINTLYKDKENILWIGAAGGLYSINYNTKEFKKYEHTSKEKNSITYGDVKEIFEDKSGALWIGTKNGLNKYIRETDEFKHFTIEDGLPSNAITNILVDNQGDLWISAGKFISTFNGEHFRNYDEKDGVNAYEFNTDAAIKNKNGVMYFGGVNGFIKFDPKSVKDNPYPPKIVLTSFKKYQKVIKTSLQLIRTKQISLSYKDDFFSFEFAALDYTTPSKNQYAYMLEGFDKDWYYVGDRRYASYTNLDPGKYIFRVKASNNDGVWNEKGRAIAIIISPPWWKTYWAYGAYFILIVSGFLLIRRFELNRVKLRNELKLREFEVKKKSELEELKSRFFANLSHEFRTPLMLIKGPLEQIKKGNDNHAENIEIIERNSIRLKELIDQLLELSQLEKAAIPLVTKREDIIEILKGLISSFESLADKNNISLNFESNFSSIEATVDRDKFEKIINNLLLNAIKFTPNSGSVKIKANELSPEDKKSVQIRISDTGVGIPTCKLDKIFDRFYQVTDSSQRSYGGSGIGLALVKEFIDLHKWKISVSSKLETGTEFIIELPVDSVNLIENKTKENLISTTNKKNYENNKIPLQISSFSEQSELSASNKKPILLIVDDSEDVIRYLSSLLRKNYEIFTAFNGEEGITNAIKIMPDLIISDVMMPSMDGMEFCTIIKSDWRTSDIPIILLTAKASFESKIEGLEIGADDYLTKPFDSRELFTRIKNLLEQRKRLRDKYTYGFQSIIDKEKINTADNDFIKKALNVIETNLDNENFTTETLASELFVSRTQLHRKFNEITKHSPGQFIRIFKLQHAAKLLAEGNFQITQIAYEVGFSSPAQFTRAFTKHFNCLPSEFSSKK